MAKESMIRFPNKNHKESYLRYLKLRLSQVAQPMLSHLQQAFSLSSFFVCSNRGPPHVLLYQFINVIVKLLEAKN